MKLTELPKPIPANDEILVRVWATTVNRTDCAILTATPFVQRFFTGLLKPSSPIPGTDFAGTVEAVGKKVTGYGLGDNVWGFSDLGLASQAQYMCVSAKSAILKMPEGIDHFHAVACAEGAHYAYNCINKLKVEAGSRVLVNGASGAVGSAALQMLVALKCKVTAVSGTKNIETMRRLGADTVIDYEKDDFTKVAEGPFNLIVDAVGKSRFRACKPLLSHSGVYISSELGPGNENLILPLTTRLKNGQRVIFPFPSNVLRSMKYVQELVILGKFKPLIDRTYPMEEIKDAYQYVMSGSKTGNVIITYE